MNAAATVINVRSIQCIWDVRPPGSLALYVPVIQAAPTCTNHLSEVRSGLLSADTSG